MTAAGGEQGKILALARSIGITRLADITGLDRAGIPVVQCTRPGSLSNIVSQGKGATLAEAARSAVFESIESFAAERIERYNVIHSSPRALGAVERFGAYLLTDAASDWPDRVMPWAGAINLATGKQDYVPLALVHTCFTVPPPDDGATFMSSTTGLAAGFDAAQARSHGLLECIERDAIARAHRVHGFYHRARIDPATIDDAGVQTLLQDLAARGFAVGLWHAVSPSGYPVIWCHLMEDCEPSAALVPLPSEGTAARADPAQAIRQAIYEAAQSRLTAIAGTRDDFTRSDYPLYPDLELLAAHWRLLKQGPKPVAFSTIPSGGEGADCIVAALEAAGIRDILMVSLPVDGLSGVSVVKLVIPDCEPFFEGGR